jgi:hypothetical protein
MIPKQVTQSVVNFQKVAMDTTYKTMSLVHDQTENMMHTVLSQNVSWIPQEGQNMFKEWTNVCKKTRDDYKKTMDSCFDQFENMMKHSQ